MERTLSGSRRGPHPGRSADRRRRLLVALVGSAAVLALSGCGGISDVASTAQSAAWVATNSDMVLADIATLNDHQSAIIAAQQAQDLPALAAATAAAGADATEMKQRYEASDMPEGDVRTVWLGLLDVFSQAGTLSEGISNGDTGALEGLIGLQEQLGTGWAAFEGVFGELLPGAGTPSGN